MSKSVSAGRTSKRAAASSKSVRHAASKHVRTSARTVIKQYRKALKDLEKY